MSDASSARPTHLAISGELGSGKTSVARQISSAARLKFVSTGMLQRRIAESRNLSTLEANLVAEEDEVIDRRVDETLRELGESATPTVFDSRMAWHFVKSALKVHMIVDPVVGAERIFARGSSSVEGYRSPAHAQEALELRYQSERRRFSTKYGVDISRLRNYDVVVDTTYLSADEAAVLVLDTFDAASSPASTDLRLALERLILAEPREGKPVLERWRRDSRAAGRVPVLYARPWFVALEPPDSVPAGSLVEAELLAEEGDSLPGGATARGFVQRVVEAAADA